jgi:hypothetical protein
LGKFKDYTEISFDENWKRYDIGDSCNLELIASEVMVLCSKDCLIKFLDSFYKESEPAEILIPHDVYISFGGIVRSISVKRKTDNGILQVWSEGNKLVQL